MSIYVDIYISVLSCSMGNCLEFIPQTFSFAVIFTQWLSLFDIRQFSGLSLTQ